MISFVAKHRARPIALATVEGRRAAHEVALMQPMVGCAFVGEPKIVGAGRIVMPVEWYACQYATALLRQRDPAFAGDLRHLEARLNLFREVEFSTEVRCRKTAANPSGLKWIVVARVALPQPAAAPATTTIDVTWSDLRSGDRAAPPALPAPSPAPAIPAGMTEGSTP